MILLESDLKLVPVHAQRVHRKDLIADMHGAAAYVAAPPRRNVHVLHATECGVKTELVVAGNYYFVFVILSDWSFGLQSQAYLAQPGVELPDLKDGAKPGEVASMDENVPIRDVLFEVGGEGVSVCHTHKSELQI